MADGGLEPDRPPLQPVGGCGLGGTFIEQFTDDKRNGRTVPAVAGMNGQGNRAQSLSLGPVAGYGFGRVSIRAYVLSDLYAGNTAGGTRAWLQLGVAL